MMRGREEVSRQAHNLEIGGSIPSSAININYNLRTIHTSYSEVA